MSFETDKQTLDDLNILGKYKNDSVYSIFGGIVTRGENVCWRICLPTR